MDCLIVIRWECLGVWESLIVSRWVCLVVLVNVCMCMILQFQYNTVGFGVAFR